jgi:hypothetical protein
LFRFVDGLGVGRIRAADGRGQGEQDESEGDQGAQRTH